MSTFWTDRTNFEVDPDTGLPELPENYFWRVEEGYTFSLYDYKHLQIRKKVWGGLFSVKKQWTVIHNDKFSKEKILDTANYILLHVYDPWNEIDLEREKEDRKEKQKPQNIQSNLFGDYPPKSLEN